MKIFSLTWRHGSWLTAGALAALLFTGCPQPTNNPPTGSGTPAAGGTEEEHGHSHSGDGSHSHEESGEAGHEEGGAGEAGHGETGGGATGSGETEPAAGGPAENPGGTTSNSTEGNTGEGEPAENPPAAEENPVNPPAAEGAQGGEQQPNTGAAVDAQPAKDPLAVVDKNANAQLKPGDWAMWGGSPFRNNVPVTTAEIPIEWQIGDIDSRTGVWDSASSENIRWVAQLGSQTYGNPVVAGGRVFVGTNNSGGYLPRYPSDVDLGCLLAFDEKTGAFLWQASSEKLPTGRVHDWPLQGICCAPYVEGERLWYVTSRGEVVCLDTAGYHDGEDDGPVQNEWARQFLVSPDLFAGLDEKVIGTGLAAHFEAAGEPLAERTSIKTEEEGTQWLITSGEKDAETRYRVTVVENEVKVEKLTTAETGEESAAEVFTAPVKLTVGLDEGSMSLAMRKQLEAAGLKLAEEFTAPPTKNGPAWEFTAEVAGKQRQFKAMMQGPNFTAYMLTTPDDKHEADTIWRYDMMKELGVSQHNMCSCSIAAWGDILFVNTSNGVDESHINIPAVDAPSFIAMNKDTAEVYWTDKSPGVNILHGQWSSPTIAELGGVVQVIFGGGDGWVRSFRADTGKDGKPELLWEFDANPKTTKWVLGGRGTRNNIIATPVVYDGLLYVAVGQDPEHGEGEGHLWCIDPTKRGDVSAQLAVKREDPTKVIPHKRMQAVVEEEGEVAIPNPNSAAIWHFDVQDRDEDGKISFEETMHRSCGTVAIQDDLLFIADFSGLFHCLDAKTGKVHWAYDMLAPAWGSPLIVGGHVYIGDEDGDVSIFKLSADPEVAMDGGSPISEIYMDNAVYSTPIVANDTLFISNKSNLFAIAAGAEPVQAAAPAAAESTAESE